MLALLLLEDAAANLSPSLSSSNDSNDSSSGSSTTPAKPPLFQLAIFLSGHLYPLAHPLLARGARISIPTTHIWGGKRDYVTTNGAGEALRDACVAEGRCVVEHGEGHVVPRGAGVGVVVAGVERGVRRAIFKS
jgi:pimeloyl-ACP methyl ester carboxylesterase